MSVPKSRSCLQSPKFAMAAGIAELVAQLKELMGCMNPTSYRPTESHLWLVGKITPETWTNCRETSERKAQTHTYDDLIDLLIQLAMERENDSHMDEHLHEHVRRESLAEKSPEGRSPQPHSIPWNGRGETFKQMKATGPSKGRGAPNLVYCHPKDDKGRPCHAPDGNGQRFCMLQLLRKLNGKDGQEVKHQDQFCRTITCSYFGKR